MIGGIDMTKVDEERNIKNRYEKHYRPKYISGTEFDINLHIPRQAYIDLKINEFSKDNKMKNLK